ncbi:(d)CMP kinase, partial [Bacillus cereus]
YRAITYLALKKGVDLNDEAALTALLKESAIDLTVSPEGEQKVYIAGEDVTEAIRTDDVSNQVSIVAKYAGIREEMTKRQQQLAEK